QMVLSYKAMELVKGQDAGILRKRISSLCHCGDCNDLSGYSNAPVERTGSARINRCCNTSPSSRPYCASSIEFYFCSRTDGSHNAKCKLRIETEDCPTAE